MLKAQYKSLVTPQVVDGVTFNAAFTKRSVDKAITRVNAGMAQLDKKVPDWRSRISIPRLDMRHGALCIIGQSLGGYDSVRVGFVACFADSPEELEERLWGNQDNGWTTNESLLRRIEKSERALGFMEDVSVPFALLDIVWIAALEKRDRRGNRSFLRVPS